MSLPEELPRRYAGDVKRDLLRSYGPIAPWGTWIRVEALPLERGTRFEVSAEWTGPPAFGFPPDPGPGLRRDCYVVEDLELARGIAIRAREEFAKGGDQAPDLRDLAAELRRK